jgi:hypothetical protein
MAMTRKGYLYQYDGVDWIELDPKIHGDMYMSALPDLLENAPDGAFNNLFCLNLIAQKAFVKYLQALEITLSELTENGKTQRGSIKSQNYKQGASGFKIDYNGDCEFNNGKFRGRVEADEGFFSGLLENPVLRASTEQVLSDQRSYAAGTGAQSLTLSEAQFWGENPNNNWLKTYNVQGTHNGRDITQIIFYRASGRPLVNGSSVTFIYFNGSEERIWDNNPIGDLSFRRITQGWNIQMLNLPTADPKIANVLWRDGTTLKISVG